MFMQAIVVDVRWDSLLVWDLRTQQSVVVFTPDARWFRPGNQVRIWYNGVMTASIPPQIFALNISLEQPNVPPPIRPLPPVMPVPPIGSLPVFPPDRERPPRRPGRG